MTAPTKRGAEEVLDLLLDAGSYRSWDRPVEIDALDSDYRNDLASARRKAGTDESVLTGRGRVNGRDVAVIVSEFGFLAGSIGRAAAERIIAAIGAATAERLPLLALPASGGTRMQEGTPAFMQMIAISRAVMTHRAAGLPYLAHLRHPTTGGVLASWGSLGHVTTAEPGALVGFLGPRVYEALNGEPFPEGVQLAENLAANGVVDAVATLEEFAQVVDGVLSVWDGGLRTRPAAVPSPTSPSRAPEPTPAWDSVEATRSGSRAGLAEFLTHGTTGPTTRLCGTGEGERDDSVAVYLTRVAGEPCVLIGQDRSAQKARPLGPAALRQARRAMRLASELRLPVVTLVDTPGAELSKAAEEGAMAGEIARSIAALTTLDVPTVALLLGQGCGGGALALLGTDTIIATEHSWLAPLPPEGASVIMHGTVDHAAAMGTAQRIRAVDLHDAGLVHAVVAEPDNGDPGALVEAVADACAAHLRGAQRTALSA